MIFTPADTLRPGFSLPMELLCSIPRYPAFVRMETLVKDLDMRSQLKVHEILRNLKAIGFEVLCTNHAKKGRVVYITRGGWKFAEAAAENYWQTVWGDQRGTAIDLGGEAAEASAAA